MERFYEVFCRAMLEGEKEQIILYHAYFEP